MAMVDTARGEVWTVIVAAGSGSRFGSSKLFKLLGQRRVLDWSISAAAESSHGVVLVLAEEHCHAMDESSDLIDTVVIGGSTRAQSVRAGLDAVPQSANIICVHDAARPFARPELFLDVIDAVAAGADAAIPGLPVIDTVKLLAATDGAGQSRVDSTLDRSKLVVVQTPQAFSAEVLRKAHSQSGEGTDDASLVEQFGGTVVVVAGDPKNQKITFPEDLIKMNQSLNPNISAIRIGHGFDVHSFSDEPGRTMVLGGICFDGVRGLEGHSDADAVCHAIIDALLSATGNGDIGQKFPDTDERFVDANSAEMLREVSALLSAGGWRVHNVDCTVVAEEPKLAPRRQEMQELLTDIVGGQVSVKGKRAEGLGAIGRGEGVACWAVALVAQEIPE